MLAADKPVGGKECPMEHFHGLFDATKYLVEDFSVTTDDGYIIKSWRVRLQPSLLEKLPAEYKKNINQPIHFQHGLALLMPNKNHFQFLGLLKLTFLEKSCSCLLQLSFQNSSSLDLNGSY